MLYVDDISDQSALSAAITASGQMTIPPLRHTYQIVVKAYGSGNGGGDHSTADMWLYHDGNEVAFRHDQSFHSYSFDVEYSFLLQRGRTAVLEMRHENTGANVTAQGLNIVSATVI